MGFSGGESDVWHRHGFGRFRIHRSLLEGPAAGTYQRRGGRSGDQVGAPSPLAREVLTLDGMQLVGTCTRAATLRDDIVLLAALGELKGSEDLVAM